MALQFVNLAWPTVSQNSISWWFWTSHRRYFSIGFEGQKWSRRHFTFTLRRSVQRILLVTSLFASLLIFLIGMWQLPLFPESSFSFSASGPCVLLAIWPKTLVSPIGYTLHLEWKQWEFIGVPFCSHGFFFHLGVPAYPCFHSHYIDFQFLTFCSVEFKYI